MTDSNNFEERKEGAECLTSGCSGHMVDTYPVETARSDQFLLIRIECPVCHARAWRIESPSEE